MFISATDQTTNRKPYRLFLLAAMVATGMIGCEQPSDNSLPNESSSTSTHDTDVEHNASPDTTTQIQPPISSKATPITIDWSAIDTGVASVDPQSFSYPFSEDSEAVMAYAEFFDVTPSEATHSLTVGTASNEPLSDLIDQLGEHYLSHKLTDGAQPTLIVTTTSDVTPSTYDYVIENEFARGLILPIVIEPKATTKTVTP